jgi:hypothetical protein
MSGSPSAQSNKDKAATIETVQALMGALPGVEEGSSFGTPGFRVRGKFLARLREDGETLVVKLGFGERAMLMEAEPETFYITDHYRDYPAVLVRLANVDPGMLHHLLEQAWRQAAPKRLVAAYDKTGANGKS